MNRTITQLLPLFSLGLAPVDGESILHYRVSADDATSVASGTIPGVDGSENGTVFSGQVTLSEDLPTDGVPADAGDRSLSFDGSSGINLPGTQQLLNSTIEAAGGFTYEAWFNFSGGGNINSIIDYAGTEKFVREAGQDGAGYRNNSALPLYPLGVAGIGEWHYAAVVFTPTGPVSGGSITGDFTFYFDGTEATETLEAVTISDFGDSLNRTISVGAHPLGFGGDFFNGLIFEPRVSLAALSPEELLYGQSAAGDLKITSFEPDASSNRLSWTSIPGKNYLVEFSLNLEDWNSAGIIPADQEITEFVHEFVPGFEDLIDSPAAFYRVTRQD